LKECRKLNPEYNQKDLMDIKNVIKDLIVEKDKIYPDIKVQIFDAQLKGNSSKTYVTVASVNIS